MRIELLGLPGSGKSSLYRGIVHQSNFSSRRILSLNQALYEGLTKSNKKKLDIKNLTYRLSGSKHIKNNHFYLKYKLNYLSVFIAKNTDLAELILHFINKEYYSGHEKEMVLSWFYGLFSDYHVISNFLPDEKDFIIDEGFIQRTITLFSYGDSWVDLNGVEKYLELIPKPETVIYVEAEPEHCYERLLSRGFPKRLARKNKEEIDEFFEKCLICINEVKCYYEKNNLNLVVVRNNNNEMMDVKSILQLFS